MEIEFQYIIDLAKRCHQFVQNPKQLYDALNELPVDEVNDIYTEYGDPESRFQPVNILRSEVAKRLKERKRVDETIVEEIKNKIRSKDKEFFFHIYLFLVKGVRRVPCKWKRSVCKLAKAMVDVSCILLQEKTLETTQFYLEKCASN